MTISSKAIDAIKNNSRVVALLMLKFDKTAKTIDRWFTSGSPMLRTADALQIIKEETGLTDAEILEDSPANN